MSINVKGYMSKKLYSSTTMEEIKNQYHKDIWKVQKHKKIKQS